MESNALLLVFLLLHVLWWMLAGILLHAVSTVRADTSGGVGFLQDVRRMNVALTRARYGCFVVGRESTLSRSPPWQAFLRHASAVNSLVDVPNADAALQLLQPRASHGNGRNE